MSKINFKKSRSKGFSLIELLIVIVITGILAAIAVPNLLASRRSANEASAVACLRTITSVQGIYQSSFGAGNFGTLTQLAARGFIDTTFGTSPYRKNRYLFEMDVYPPGPGQTAGYTARARPQHHTNVQPLTGAGTRDFGTNETGIIFSTSNATLVDFDPTTRAPLNGSTPIN